MKKNIVFDTNTLISAAIRPYSIPAQAYNKAILEGEIVYSKDTLSEFMGVLWRKKFDKYITEQERNTFLNFYERTAISIIVTEFFTPVCRDPKDDKYLALAISANSKIIVTGDEDLLVLHPYENISILNASDFLKLSL